MTWWKYQYEYNYSNSYDQNWGPLLLNIICGPHFLRIIQLFNGESCQFLSVKKKKLHCFFFQFSNISKKILKKTSTKFIWKLLNFLIVWAISDLHDRLYMYRYIHIYIYIYIVMSDTVGCKTLQHVDEISRFHISRPRRA